MPEAPEIIKELVDTFERNKKAYKKSEYKEEQLKQEFINKFFIALGWDVYNEDRAAPQYRDVIFEDSIKIGTGTKAPDYCFTLSGRRMFFVEAKKPYVKIENEREPAYQLRRYAWSGKLPLSILTNFENMAIYESRMRPNRMDKTAKERIMIINYTEYIDKWDYIYSNFSYDAVKKGSFDNYAKSIKGKRGTQEVDDAFLIEIEEWREKLAKNIALRNKTVTRRELNYSVQQIINRLIFLRMAEDRGLEKYGKLFKINREIDEDKIYGEFCKICKESDDKYNSGLFHFKEEKGRVTNPDKLTLDLRISNRVLREIIKDLYYPESPYEFSVISPEILGHVYEQFLGKIIRLTRSHMAKVDEKPEVKKAGGVYYTPQFIVDYIVKNTIGRLCKDLTPKKVTEQKILDPSCGSGSFLLGAYDYLLKWHLDYYTNLKDKRRLKDKIYEIKDGEWHLTIQEKKRILLNNIYGVDIDPQAVEVTKLSLLLKVLEGESKDGLEAQKKLYNERALPDLDNNIKCGNSLISSDIYETEEVFTRSDIRRINAFDWNDEFPEIMSDGGFNAIIGNPPWGASFSDVELNYLRKAHDEIIIRMIDSYMYFIHLSIKILNPDGIFGMIIPSTILTQTDTEALRRYLIGNVSLYSVINLGQKIFGPKVLNTSTILTFSNNNSNPIKTIKVGDIRHCEPIEKPIELKKVKAMSAKVWLETALADPICTFFTLNLPGVKIFQKLTTTFPLFKDFIDGKIQRGISPDYKDAFIIENDVATKERIEKSILRPVVIGENISKYSTPYTSKSVIYLTREDDINKYPNAKAFLTQFRKKITCKEVKEDKHPWFSLHRPRNPHIFESPKFIGLTTTKKIIVALDEKMNYYATDALYLFKIKSDFNLNNHFILGILQSKFFYFLYQISIQGEQRVIPQIKAAKLYNLPFPLINVNNSQDIELHDKMVSLVERMLQLNQDMKSMNVPSDKEMIQRQKDVTDKQIDNLVYDLYDLSDEEIKIVEDSSN